MQTMSLRLESAPAQPKSADVVIIGGGVIGVSIAYHLAQAGVQNIVLIEQYELGSGSSAKPLGGVRANFSDPGNIQLGQRSLAAFERFEDDFGTDIHLNQVGYLFLARTEDEVSSLEESAQIQNSMGITSQIVDPGQAAQLNPLLDPTALLAASYSPHDGYADPAAVVGGYAQASQDLGVTVLHRTEVTGIETEGDAIRSVTTNRGGIAAETVVCCAGAWSTAIGAMAGVDLPVVPVRRMIGLTPPRPAPRVPFTLDLGTTMYFHNSRDGLLLGVSHAQQPGFCRDYCHEWTEEFSVAAAICAPELAHPELAGGWAGYYENTPDHNALIGQEEKLPGFFYATGFSGHGFLQGPAVGELMADLYLGRESFMDHRQFSAARFSHADRVLHEVNII